METTEGERVFLLVSIHYCFDLSFIPDLEVIRRVETKSNFIIMNILYTRLFSLRVIFVLLHLQMVSLRLKFAQTRLCTKAKPWDINICPVLNSPAANEGKRGENKKGANISLFTVCIYGGILLPLVCKLYLH